MTFCDIGAIRQDLQGCSGGGAALPGLEIEAQRGSHRRLKLDKALHCLLSTCQSLFDQDSFDPLNMSSSTDPSLDSNVPILLLKTKSSPGDGYEEIFSQPHDGRTFEPCFVPVLEHRFEPDGVAQVESILQAKKIGRHPDATIGGLIFTSQRAVEAFTKIVEDGQS